MRRIGTLVAATAITGLAGVGVAACGSSDDGAGNPASGKAGGSIRIGSTMPDSYDPVIIQTTQANQALQLVYTGLLTYKHEPGLAANELIPGLAEALPKTSADKKTYTFKLRPHLKYSDGSRVRASDFEHTIKRLLFLGGPYSSFSNGIVGAATYLKAKKPNADIAGITSNERTREIKVKLTAPDSKFLLAIALVSGAPTPAAKSPFKTSPSIPGAGPYKMRIQNPTRQFTLTPNRRFDVPTVPSRSSTRSRSSRRRCRR